MRRGLTPSQTVGPFFHGGLMWLDVPDLAGTATGERIDVSGTIVDGDGAVVPDAMLELWQANAQGRYAHPADRQNTPLEPGFKGFGRIATDKAGVFRFRSIKPGSVPGIDGKVQSPHINVTLFMRGQLTHLQTRIYFADDASLAGDPALALVDPKRRDTLLARRVGDEPARYEWNIVMQGRNETVFFQF